MKLTHRDKSNRRPIVVPAWATVLLSPILIPLALLACIVSIPLTKIHFNRLRKKERRLAERMADSRRTISFEETSRRVQLHEGTLLSEQFLPKGPHRFWWTPEEIAQISPYALPLDPDGSPLHAPKTDAEFDAAIPFYRWAFERYLSPGDGSAFLVVFTEAERNSPLRPFTHVPHIPILSQFAGNATT